MDRNNKTKYLNKFIELSNLYLKKDYANNEYKYLLSRISKNKLEQFAFGYFPTDYSLMIEFIDEFGKLIKEAPIPILKDCGIIYQTEKYNKIVSAFKYHSLLIPVFDIYSNPISIIGRTIVSDDIRKTQNISKYKYLPFQKRRHIYGLNLSYKNIIKKDYVVVVEGQFDFISGFINGIDNIVALGGSKFSFEQIALLKRFTNNFYVLLDNDEAGIAGLESIKKNTGKYGLLIKQLTLPDEYKDLDEYLKNNQINDIVALITI